MKKDKGASAYVMPSVNAKEFEVLLENKKATVKFATMLHKQNSSEVGGIYVGHFDICNYDKNVIELEYNESADSWYVKNFEYNEETQSWQLKEEAFNQIPKVTLELNKNEATGKCEEFVLRRGETKQLPITYNVDDRANSAQGVAKITYTISWE